MTTETHANAQFFGTVTVGSGTVVDIVSGSGSPEGAVTAIAGSIYLRTDGAIGTTLYVKESGAGNTGWIARSGYDGLPGLDGVAGAAGAAGPTGPTGPTGPQGNDGVDGLYGLTGSTGVTGVTGAAAYVAGGKESLTSITGQSVFTTGAVTSSETATATGLWRVEVQGTFVAQTSTVVRTAEIACFWGSTQLPAITPTVLVSSTRTTSFNCTFFLMGVDTTHVYTTGSLVSGITPTAPAAGLVSQVDHAVPASTVVTSGAQTLDVRFRTSTAVSLEGWTVENVVIERLSA